MKENRYVILFSILVLLGISAYLLFPNFQTQEFDQDVVENIMEGVTTTVLDGEKESINTENNENNFATEKPIANIPEIENLLDSNKTPDINDNITAYLLIGSDERGNKDEDGYVDGKRADVIILGFFNETIN